MEFLQNLNPKELGNRLALATLALPQAAHGPTTYTHALTPEVSGNLVYKDVRKDTQETVDHLQIRWDPLYGHGSLMLVICSPGTGSINIRSREIDPPKPGNLFEGSYPYSNECLVLHPVTKVGKEVDQLNIGIGKYNFVLKVKHWLNNILTGSIQTSHS